MLQSLESQEKSYIRFINRTERSVDLVWLNFNGEYIRYGTLQKDYFLDVNTYKTHPWIAVDHFSKDRLHIDKTFVYYPITSREFITRRHPGKSLPLNFETRIRICITLPVYSLKFGAMLAIRNMLKTTDQVDQLEIPKQLIEELKRAVEHRNRLVNILDSQLHI